MDTNDNNKLFSKNSVKSMVVGAIISIIVAKIFEPFLTFLYSLFLKTQGGLASYISDSTYQKIALGFSEQSSSLTLYFFMLVFMTYILYHRNRFGDSYKKYIKSLKTKINLGVESDSPTQDAVSQEKSSKTIELKENSVQLKKDLRFMQVVNFAIQLFYYGLLIFAIFTYTQRTFVNAKIAITTNNIEIVSPYITDDQYKQLKSEFHLIKNESDYEALVQKLESYAKNNVELKKSK